jgi:hypothetical protein
LTAWDGGGLGGLLEHAPKINPAKIGPSFVSNVLAPKLILGCRHHPTHRSVAERPFFFVKNRRNQIRSQ